MPSRSLSAHRNELSVTLHSQTDLGIKTGHCPLRALSPYRKHPRKERAYPGGVGRIKLKSVMSLFTLAKWSLMF